MAIFGQRDQEQRSMPDRKYVEVISDLAFTCWPMTETTVRMSWARSIGTQHGVAYGALPTEAASM